MFSKLATALFLVLISVTSGASSFVPSQDEMLTGLNTMQGIYQSSYAMQGWKKNHIGFDLVRAFDSARNQVNANPQISLKEYQKMVHKILTDMNDYHVSIRFQRTEAATLPLTIRSAGGQYFIAQIDRSLLSPTAFPFQVGDEVVEFAGHSISQEIQSLREVYYGGVEETDQGLSELMLTARSGARGFDVPQGPVMIGVRPKGSTVIKHVQLIWKYTPEVIQNEVPASLAKVDDGLTKLSMNKMMMWGNFESAAPAAESEFDIGARKSYVPDLGIKIWEADPTSKFYANIVRTPSNHILGFVRIPHYLGDATWIAEFVKVIERMEKSTDAMVIDEIDNPGGSVFYLYALASLLTQQPMVTPHHQMKITAADAVSALQLRATIQNIKTEADLKELVGDLDGYPLSLQLIEFIRTYTQFINAQWSRGNTLTDPAYIYGADQINPYPATTYSKPILLMTNALDFSGGDFFPAIMQDNKRVTVFGTRTAGAGGYVLQNKFPNRLGIDMFTVTGSIAWRVNNDPIENLGVTPDINYALTPADLTTGFAPYRAAILQAVEGLIK